MARVAGGHGATPVVVAGGPAGAGGALQFPLSSLYVGDLEPTVTDSQIHDLFSQVGPVVSVRVCRDITTGSSLGYCYVKYSSSADAAKALDVLNFTHFDGKPIRIMYSNCDPSTQKSGGDKIFIKNLDKEIDNKALYEMFVTFGGIACKVATDPSGQSKGYGFVQFEQEEAAGNAICQLNGMLLNGKQVYVGPFLSKQERENSASESLFSNVFVKNLSETTTKEQLEEVFGQYGDITSAVVKREGDGKSKCFGFVNFVKPDAAARAVEELNGKKFDNKKWYVGKAQKKSEREVELKRRFDQSAEEVAEKFQAVRFYLKKLDDSVGDDELRELFSEFGTVISCKVRDSYGIRWGSVFVAFLSPEDMSRALADMNGKMIGSKPLYVPTAQHEEDRRARLQAQFSAVPSNVVPRMPMLPPGAPGLGLQLFYARAPPGFIPPQMLKESLYPLVDRLEHESAAELTDMLLKMDQTEVLHLLKSPEALKTKVAEFMDMLRNVVHQQPSEPTDQLASLSLNDANIS